MHPDSKHAAAATDASGNRARQFANQLPMIKRRWAPPDVSNSGEETTKRGPDKKFKTRFAAYGRSCEII